jgi:uncharacterized membrane protein
MHNLNEAALVADRRRYVYSPFSRLITVFIIITLVILFIFIFLGLVGVVFARIGFSAQTIILLLLLVLIGSFINIPLFTLESSEAVMTDEYVTVFGMTYRVPAAAEGSRKTVVAINVGGALIPSVVSLYLLWQFPDVVAFAIVGVTLVAVISHLISKPVKGVGIVSPALVSPYRCRRLYYRHFDTIFRGRQRLCFSVCVWRAGHPHRGRLNESRRYQTGWCPYCLDWWRWYF